MSAGTIRLTNGSTAAVGTGTAFTTDLVSADFITTTIAGTTYSLAVDSVTNATNLVLSLPFNGPTTAAAAWQAVPRKALLRVTAELNKQVTESLRLGLVNSVNWQAVYSGSGNITVTMPDGSTFTGPSWKYLSDNAAIKSGGAVPVNQGGTGAKTNEGARSNLGLGSSATRNAYSTSGDMLSVGDFGLGSNAVFSLLDDAASHDMVSGFYNVPNGYMPQIGITADFNYLTIQRGLRPTRIIQAYSLRRTFFSYSNGSAWTYHEAYTTGNTTKTSDGTLKAASPIVKIYSDGLYETNEESQGCTVTRLALGQYLIEGCTGMNSDASWGGIDGGFDIPHDRNKQPLIWLDYEVNADGSVLVKTYHRTHPEAPAFARNLIGTKDDAGNFTETVLNGEPIDIPDDVFISVRVEMPADSIYHKALS